MRSQHGPLGSSALTAVPTYWMTRIEPQLFPVVLRRRTGTARFLKQPAEVRSVVTPNWWVLGVGPVWWCWQLKSEGAGLPKPGHFWPNLPRQSLLRKHFSFRSMPSKLGGCAGQVFSRATAKAVATSLLELKAAHGSDGDTPSCSEVVGDHLCGGLIVFCKLRLCFFLRAKKKKDSHCPVLT